MGTNYLVKKRIIKGKQTWGFILESRKKESKISKDDMIKLVEQYPKQVVLDFANKDKVPVYLTVIEGKPTKNDKIKKSLRTLWGDREDIRNKVNSIKPVSLEKSKNIPDFKIPEKKLITV